MAIFDDLGIVYSYRKCNVNSASKVLSSIAELSLPITVGEHKAVFYEFANGKIMMINFKPKNLKEPENKMGTTIDFNDKEFMDLLMEEFI